MHTDTVTILRADSDDGPIRVTRKAFESVYREKGYDLLEPEATDARPDAFVPGANIETILAWVAGIAERARQALEAEEGQKSPRPKLIAALERIIDEEEPAGSGDELELGSGDALEP